MVKKNVASEVEKTLLSFDDDIVLEENPFLVTRLKAAREIHSPKRKKEIIVRMDLSHVLALILLLINLITMVYNYKWDTKQNVQEQLVVQLKADFQIDQAADIF
jgi:hypothetical protein